VLKRGATARDRWEVEACAVVLDVQSQLRAVIVSELSIALQWILVPRTQE